MRIALLALALIVSACGGANPAATATGRCYGLPIVGTWVASSFNKFTIDEKCAAQSDYCGYDLFDYWEPPATEGSTATVRFWVNKSNGGGCSTTQKAITISYYLSGNSLTIDYGSAVENYTRQ